MIRVTGLCKRFADTVALDNASLLARRKELSVILGPSGCGKTTMLRAIAGLEEADEGEIAIEGREVSSPVRRIAPRERDLGMIFQDLALWPHMRALDNVSFGLGRKGEGRRSVRTRAREALARVSLEHLAERYPHELSGGERQRLAIARVLAPEPRCLLMDEPFNNLDPLLKEDMTGLVKDLCASLGTTILYVTHGFAHGFDEVLALADQVFLMSEGRIAGGLGANDLRNLSRRDLMSWYRETLSV